MSHVSDTPDLDRAGPDGELDVLTDDFDAQLPDDFDEEPARGGWFAWKSRRAGRAIVRRPLDWIDAPWTVERIVRVFTTFIFLFVSTIITLKVVHWDLVLENNTPTGGDMGAHVMGPAYLRDHLLSDFRISGWSPYWYDGFPLYRFYMVIPALMIVALNVILPYGIAFKIVVVAGIITLPIFCWAFGRLARFAFPVPELFSLAAIIFLLDDSFSIYGGNVKSTMAGEFSFSIALSFAVLGLGLFACGLETGKHRSITAVVLALAVLCHGIVAIFVLVTVTLMALVWMDRARLKYTLTTLGPMVLLTAFWIIPFWQGRAFMTDMKYEPKPEGANESYWSLIFNLDVTLDRIIFVLALIGFIGSIRRRHLTGVWLGISIIALCVLMRWAEGSDSLLWNPRVLPFIYFLRYLSMMVGIGEVIRGIVWIVTRARVGYAVSEERRVGHSGVAVALPTERSTAIGGTIGAMSTLLVVLLILAVEFQVNFNQGPFSFGSVTQDGRYALSLGVGGSDWQIYENRSTNKRGLADSWAKYNFTGYEGRNAYGEYKQLVDDMAAIGDDPTYGCGRALWENNGDNGNYGTTMALMLLPHWTDGCIDSSEGLFFEASGTTPYHFLSAAALSSSSSNPVRELRYDNNDPAIGVPYLQKLGIRYYMAWTDLAVTKADATPGLTPIKTSGPWHIYQVADTDIVVPLTVQPVVVNERSGDARERWLELGTSWFQNPDEWAAMPAADGPESWQRIDVVVDESREQPKKVSVVVPEQTIEPKQLPPVTVSNVKMGNETVDFDVDQVGVPVLVKVSYFPNWKVSGAEGPYRIAPNLMVVVPTSNHVTMEYGRSMTDYLAYFLTFLGIVLLFVFKRYVPIKYPSPHPFVRSRGSTFDESVQIADQPSYQAVSAYGDGSLADRGPPDGPGSNPWAPPDATPPDGVELHPDLRAGMLDDPGSPR